MRQHRRIGVFSCLFALGAILFGISALAQSGADEADRQGVILTLSGPVTPPVAEYLEREIGAASDAGQELVIVEIDTPGGLMNSMKTIIKAILASETPVATYVSPQGAQSASAGLYIMYSAHISAMAPATNTGAATPIEMGGPGEDPFERLDPAPTDDEADPQEAEEAAGDDSEQATNPQQTAGGAEAEEDETAGERASEPLQDAEEAADPLSNEGALRAKIINDSVAYIRSLAEKRGRNADWAESAVRDAVSVTAREALELNVIDLVAEDIDDLLTQIDGRTVETAAGAKTISTTDIKLVRVEPTMIEKVLSFIADPNVALILMSLATTGIIIEMWNPGSIFPGLVGIMCLIMGLYAFQVLSGNGLFLALMGIGALLILIEAYTPTFGLAGLVGLVLFGIGMYFLFPETLRVAPAVIGSVLAIAGALLAVVLFAVIGSRSHGPMIGGDAVRKREGVVDEWHGKEGWVIIEGERWRARCDKPLQPGDRIKVVEVDGLVVTVKQAKAQSFLGGLMPGEAT